MVNRPVLIKVETTILLDFPEDWTQDLVEFHLNDSSSCVSNVLSRLTFDDAVCGCGFTKHTVVTLLPSPEMLAAHQYIDVRHKGPVH